MNRNSESVSRQRGTRRYALDERDKDDFYYTDPKALELLLLNEEVFERVWEPACGQGHLSRVLEASGRIVRSTDLIDRRFGESGVDFLTTTGVWDGDILTNPPFKISTQFIIHALDLIPDGRKVIMFLPITYLEGKSRWYNIYRLYPPKRIWVSSGRLHCGDKRQGGLMAFAWFVWVKGFKGTTELRWFNTPPDEQLTIFD